MSRRPAGWYGRKAVRARAAESQKATRTPNPGWFRTGDDPRRHVLTEADQKAGYRAAVDVLVDRYMESHGFDRPTCIRLLARLMLTPNKKEA
jgi:hypothetical protein